MTLASSSSRCRMTIRHQNWLDLLLRPKPFSNYEGMTKNYKIRYNDFYP